MRSVLACVPYDDTHYGRTHLRASRAGRKLRSIGRLMMRCLSHLRRPLPRSLRSIPEVHERDQGAYRAVVQVGPFTPGTLTPRQTLISQARPHTRIPCVLRTRWLALVTVRCDMCERRALLRARAQPAYVFVRPAAGQPGDEPDVVCAICLSNVPAPERFRFRRKAEESYHSGFRSLSSAGTFSGELLHCNHAFHRSCVQSLAEHAILRDGRWRVRCPQPGCAYRLYTSDIRELCGATSATFTRFGELRTADFRERLRQVQAGEEVDPATRDWMAQNCDVCPGCQAIISKEHGCHNITCTCDARFVHGQHRPLSS